MLLFWIGVSSGISITVVLLLIYKMYKKYLKFLRNIDCTFSIHQLKLKYPKFKYKAIEHREDIYLVSYYLFNRIFIDKSALANEIAEIKRNQYTVDEKFMRLSRLIENLNEISYECGYKNAIDFTYDTIQNTVSIIVMKNFKGDA